jgi:hypothetical protein
MAHVRQEGGAGFAIEAAAWDMLGLKAGAPVTVLPVD